MEASSQAIDLHRCDWLRFKVAIFTNLTRDHLDYHLTMENYFDAKKKLFDGRLGEKPGFEHYQRRRRMGRKIVGKRTEGRGTAGRYVLADGNADLDGVKY